MYIVYDNIWKWNTIKKIIANIYRYVKNIKYETMRKKIMS